MDFVLPHQLKRNFKMFLKKLKKNYEFFFKTLFLIFFLKKKLFKDFINGGKSRESLHCGG
jgi:hypothetical protein